MICASPHPEAWKHSFSPEKLIINCVMWKLNKPEEQMQECVLWCLCMGKWVSMEEGRGRRKWFWGAAHWLIPYDLHGWNKGNRNKSDMTSLGRIKNSGEKKSKPPHRPNLIYFPAPQIHHLYLPIITSCSPFLAHPCKIPPSVFFIKVMSSCEQAVLYVGSEGRLQCSAHLLSGAKW